MTYYISYPNCPTNRHTDFPNSSNLEDQDKMTSFG